MQRLELSGAVRNIYIYIYTSLGGKGLIEDGHRPSVRMPKTKHRGMTVITNQSPHTEAPGVSICSSSHRQAANYNLTYRLTVLIKSIVQNDGTRIYKIPSPPAPEGYRKSEPGFEYRQRCDHMSTPSARV
jgi:hypothetical protein